MTLDHLLALAKVRRYESAEHTCGHEPMFWLADIDARCAACLYEVAYPMLERALEELEAARAERATP